MLPGTVSKLVRLLVLAGCGCLVVVVLAHVAERLHVLPGMGWGLPNSPGHYVDLASAIAGIVLLLAAGALRIWKLKPSVAAPRSIRQAPVRKERC
jgi:hypothetical protein